MSTSKEQLKQIQTNVVDSVMREAKAALTKTEYRKLVNHMSEADIGEAWYIVAAERSQDNARLTHLEEIAKAVHDFDNAESTYRACEQDYTQYPTRENMEQIDSLYNRALRAKEIMFTKQRCLDCG